MEIECEGNILDKEIATLVWSGEAATRSIGIVLEYIVNLAVGGKV